MCLPYVDGRNVSIRQYDIGKVLNETKDYDAKGQAKDTLSNFIDSHSLWIGSFRLAL